MDDEAKRRLLADMKREHEEVMDRAMAALLLYGEAAAHEVVSEWSAARHLPYPGEQP